MSEATGAAPRRGMILAAGLGTRLRPVTDRVPKPLLSVRGTTLLGRAARSLRAAGILEIGINTHHLADLVADHVRDRLTAALPDVVFTLFHEPEILGTGGALWNAREFLGGEGAFLLHNGDVLCNLDLARLVAAHREGVARATLLLADWPAVNTVLLAPDGTIADVAGRLGADPAAGRALTYTGIAVLEPALLDALPAGVSSLVDALIALLREDPGAVRGFAPRDLSWSDVGTVRRYLEAHAGEGAAGESAGGSADAGAASATVEAGTGADALLLAGEPIAGHGSDRTFRRLRGDDVAAVLMRVPREDPDLERWVAVARFLDDAFGAAPAIFEVDQERREVLMEDLGDDSLFRLVAEGQARPGTDACTALYEQAIDLLVDLQVRGTRLVAEGACPLAGDRLFDHATLRWESDYFRKRFLVGVRGLDPAGLADLDAEFEALARAVLEQPVVLLHRDFQSQNILVKDGRVRVVDFQGMRRGPLLYDVMSLLNDAYVELPRDLRRQLLTTWRDRLSRAGGPELDDATLFRWARHAGLQRNMQALGAFGFLSRVKGKTWFERWIPRGVELVREGVEAETLRGDSPSPFPRLGRALRTPQ